MDEKNLLSQLPPNRSIAAFVIGTICIAIAIVGKVENYFTLTDLQSAALAAFGAWLILMSAIMRR